MERQLLTPREKDIVKLLLKNYNNAQIAQKIGSTAKAVSNRLSTVYIKFRLNNQPNPRKQLKEKIQQMQII